MSSKQKKRVLVAMSGGVDSSVAAGLLVEQGYEVIGATMQVWDYSKNECSIDSTSGTCCSSLDVDDARSVAEKLGIPFYVLNCEAKFKTAVIDPFLKAYLEGSTPLPCVNCNTYLKFDHLIKKMKELDCDYLSTGHYAQVKVNDKGESLIETSEDTWKDQTYFLFTIEPQIISKLLFPVGGMKKDEVRRLAERMGFRVAKKKDSTGICFVGNRSYSEFIEENVNAETLRKKSGVLKRFPSGEVLGEHSGIHQFTYGQSKGLGLTHHEKMFVIKIDPQNFDVWVGDEKFLYRDSVEIVDSHFHSQVTEGEELLVKVRYSHQSARARIYKSNSGWKFEFSEPQRAITPGQAAVMYRNKQLIGGGWITL